VTRGTGVGASSAESTPRRGALPGSGSHGLSSVVSLGGGLIERPGGLPRPRTRSPAPRARPVRARAAAPARADRGIRGILRATSGSSMAATRRMRTPQRCSEVRPPRRRAGAARPTGAFAGAGGRARPRKGGSVAIRRSRIPSCRMVGRPGLELARAARARGRTWLGGLGTPGRFRAARPHSDARPGSSAGHSHPPRPRAQPVPASAAAPGTTRSRALAHGARTPW
jgi:hypothetical protein